MPIVTEEGSEGTLSQARAKHFRLQKLNGGRGWGRGLFITPHGYSLREEFGDRYQWGSYESFYPAKGRSPRGSQ